MKWRRLECVRVSHSRSAGPNVVITIVGDRDGALRRAALRTYAPNRRVHSVAPGETDYPYEGEPVAYLCTADSCSLPITDPAALAAALSLR